MLFCISNKMIRDDVEVESHPTVVKSGVCCGSRSLCMAANINTVADTETLLRLAHRVISGGSVSMNKHTIVDDVIVSWSCYWFSLTVVAVLSLTLTLFLFCLAHSLPVCLTLQERQMGGVCHTQCQKRIHQYWFLMSVFPVSACTSYC